MSFIKRIFGRPGPGPSARSDQGLPASHQAIELGRRGRISVEEMLRRVSSAQLFLPLAEPPVMDGERVASWKPAVVGKPDGSRWVVAFSSEDLASAFSQRNPAYSYGLRVKTSWLMRSLPAAHGLLVNVGTVASMFEWDAEGLRHYIADHPMDDEPGTYSA